jgi:hypothetical protein
MFTAMVTTLIVFMLCSQNAEMSFNFGAQPFKYDPESGYIAVCNASKENVKHNEVGSGGSSLQNKSVKNAPQAIIIEVMYKTDSQWKMFMWCVVDRDLGAKDLQWLHNRCEYVYNKEVPECNKLQISCLRNKCSTQ